MSIEDKFYWGFFTLVFGLALLRCMHLNWIERKGAA